MPVSRRTDSVGRPIDVLVGWPTQPPTGEFDIFPWFRHDRLLCLEGLAVGGRGVISVCISLFQASGWSWVRRYPVNRLGGN